MIVPSISIIYSLFNIWNIKPYICYMEVYEIVPSISIYILYLIHETWSPMEAKKVVCLEEYKYYLGLSKNNILRIKSCRNLYSIELKYICCIIVQNLEINPLSIISLTNSFIDMIFYKPMELYNYA